MILLLDTAHLSVSSRNACFSVSDGEKSRLIAPKRIEAIVVCAKMNIDSSAFLLAFNTDVPIFYLDKFGAVVGVCRKSNFSNHTQIRRNQALFKIRPEGTEWVKGLVKLKLLGFCQNIRYFGEVLPSRATPNQRALETIERIIDEIKELNSMDLEELEGTLRGKEGVASRHYWASLSSCLPEGIRFEKRSQNPAQDPFNAALNYLYGILYTLVETSTFSVGLDPQMGIFHADQYQKPALAFDLIEPFRNWADRFLFDFFRSQIQEESFYKQKAGGIFLDKRGKAVLIPQFLTYMNRKTTFNGKITTRKGHIQNFAGDLAHQLFML